LSHNRQSIISELLNLVDKIKDFNLIDDIDVDDLVNDALRDSMQIL